MKLDTIIVLSLACLAGAHAWDRSLSTGVHMLNGYTIMVKPSELVILTPTGARKAIGL